MALLAFNGAAEEPLGFASESAPHEALLPREPHGIALGIAALLAPPTPAPAPFPAGQEGCHRWQYALRWERPSRLAVLKNVLGNSVTTYADYTAPGNGTQDDWPDPIDRSENPGAWDYTSRSLPGTTGNYDHDCDQKGNTCTGEQPGISYAKGTWDWPDTSPKSPLQSIYDPDHPPLFHPVADTTGSRVYGDTAKPPTVFAAKPYGSAGTFDGWAWTLNYGYTASDARIYGPDPGPPLPVMDETPLGGADSIPGQTGVPLNFPITFLTRGGGTITKETSPGVGGANQPTWKTSLPSDVVGRTGSGPKAVVNWGLMTFADPSPETDPALACADALSSNIKELVKVDSKDTGDVTAIEDYMRLKMFNSAPHPGLSANGGTPTKGAIEKAAQALTETWNLDPKQACDRPYGVILCTDGESNTCNTGATVSGCDPAADISCLQWDRTATPCALDTGGLDFGNFPPGAAETMYLNAHHVAGTGNAVIRPRTFAIGISSDISRCELNRIAYRGRTDASSDKKDAGFVLFDPKGRVPGDPRLPHINPSPKDIPAGTEPGTTVPTDESGAGAPATSGGINRFGFDQAPATDLRDYAFFADDGEALARAFQKIVNGVSPGDFTTSAPVAAGNILNISHKNTVLLPSTAYPPWEGHLRAVDTTNPKLDPLPTLWDAGVVLHCAATPSDPACATNLGGLVPDPLPKTWHPTPATRKLYTWNPGTGNLIEIVAAKAGTINALCGAPCTTTPITPAVIDFIRGNDGTLTDTPRKWLFGPPINSTPAIVGGPEEYRQTNNVVSHKNFEGTYAHRRALTWVGADDGFLHAFDFDDGSEVIGLLPPNLIRIQIDLFKNYLAGESQTGQNGDLGLHTWGVANSLRFADIYFPSITSYRTVGFLTTGPGGDLVAAIDITHPYPGRPSPADPVVDPDPNFDSTKPVEILWTKNSSNFAGLFGSWSVPAVAPIDFTKSRMTFGAGINPTSLFNGPPRNANVFVVDPTDGTLVSTTAIAPVAVSDTTGPLVGLQTFADSVFIQTSASGFHPDNNANLSLQADTNGRINALWNDFKGSSPNSKVLIDLNAKAGGPQPIYYSPAANGVGALGCQVFALGSGSLYETSPAVSGWNVNRTATTPPAGSGFPDTLPVFVPSLFLGTNKFPITSPSFAATPLDSTFVIQKVIGGESTGIPLSTAPAGSPGFDPTFSDGSDGRPVHTRLGIHTQITSSPLLLMNFTTGKHHALFSVYDPDLGCHGVAYLVDVEFNQLGCLQPEFAPTTTVIWAGEGASSGFVSIGTSGFAAKSGLQTNDAKLTSVTLPPSATAGAPAFVPLWWKEQK